MACGTRQMCQRSVRRGAPRSQAAAWGPGSARAPAGPWPATSWGTARSRTTQARERHISVSPPRRESPGRSARAARTLGSSRVGVDLTPGGGRPRPLRLLRPRGPRQVRAPRHVPEPGELQREGAPRALAPLEREPVSGQEGGRWLPLLAPRGLKSVCGRSLSTCVCLSTCVSLSRQMYMRQWKRVFMHPCDRHRGREGEGERESAHAAWLKPGRGSSQAALASERISLPPLDDWLGLVQTP